MDVVGMWKIESMMTFDNEMNAVWRTARELLADESVDESIKLMLSGGVLFADDGMMSLLMPVPEGEQPDESELCEGMIIAEQYPWKEEDGRLLFDAGVQGDINGEEVSPWTEIMPTENGLEWFTYRLIRAT